MNLNEEIKRLKEEREILHDLLFDALDLVQLSTGLCINVPEDWKHCKEWQDRYHKVVKDYKIHTRKEEAQVVRIVIPLLIILLSSCIILPEKELVNPTPAIGRDADILWGTYGTPDFYTWACDMFDRDNCYELYIYTEFYIFYVRNGKIIAMDCLVGEKDVRR